MANPPRSLLASSFLPTWFAVAAILALQMLTLLIQDDPIGAREPGWSFAASILAVLVTITAVGAWAFPRVRPATWLIGSMSVALLAMRHAIGMDGTVPPAVEVFAFYTTGAVLLAIGAVERARWSPLPDATE